MVNSFEVRSAPQRIVFKFSSISIQILFQTPHWVHGIQNTGYNKTHSNIE